MNSLSSLFSRPTYCVEAWGKLAETLYPEERAWLQDASKARMEEFVTVRACAREALSHLGIKRPILLAKTTKGPLWPLDVSGSLTHSGTFRAAMVTRKDEYLSIGIDAERAVPLPAGVEDRILTDAERTQIKQLTKYQRRNDWDTVFFSAKESVYKTWAPLTGRYLDFLQSELRMEPHSAISGSFTASIATAEPFSVCGAWLIEDGLIRTGAWVEAD